jgi:FtsP/CotA-like multicopper oxidase with cupredoxin domain
VLVRFHNNLPKDHAGFGVPITTIHFHGGHQAARSDGFPGALADIASCKGQLEKFFAPLPPGGAFEPGAFFDYYFPLRDPGFSFGRHAEDDRPATMWYHDHFLDFTGPNVYKGLAGFFLVFDERDTGDETGTLFPGTNLRLPSGAFDIPLVIQDKAFDAQGRLLFDTFDHDGFLGNQFVVNGTIQPFFEVQRRKYRFRLLNGSNARVYQLFLSQAVNSKAVFHFDQIATEGGLLSKPIRGIDNFRLAMAERVEIVVDFADPQFKGVTTVFLENRLQQDNGRGPDGLGAGTPLLQFRLQNERPNDPSRVPGTLRPHPTITQAELAGATRRTFEFERDNGAWAINGQFVDLCVPVARIPVNATERWRLVNKSGGWVHPIHIHLEFLHVLSRNGQVPPLNERDGNALKDTIYLGPDDEVEIALHFRDFTGPYVFHCHNLEHEDMAMMAEFNVHTA